MLKSISRSTITKAVIVIGAVASGAIALAAYDPESTSSGPDAPETGLRGFESEAKLKAFSAKMTELEAGREETFAQYDTAGPLVSESLPAPVTVTASRVTDGESITNTQEAGVDEGGIVKNAGDYLVILRRGRLFTVRTGEDDLASVDEIDAFPPGKTDPDQTWYDEMLISDKQVVVIGYSYGNAGTELNRFDISDDGELAYRDTHYMRSGDYYSSSNYASRLIGDELILYTPVQANWNDLESSLPAIRDYGDDAEPELLVKPQDFLVAEPYRGGKFPVNILHTVTRCDLSAPDLDCSATAIAGTWSRNFYVSREAVYVWTGIAQAGFDQSSPKTPGQLYRIPLDGARPGAVQVAGAPVDQFSFAEDAGDGVLRVLLRSVGNGEGMWASEFSAGDVALATVPFTSFDRGNSALVRGNYRALPEPDGWRFHNRFVGDYLLYAAGGYSEEDKTPIVYAVPLDGRDVQEVAMSHGVTRFDRMGTDAIVVGPSGDGALGFSSVSLSNDVKVEDTYMLAAATEGETRSQAFFFKPDRDSRDGLSGNLGLPVSRTAERDGAEFLGSGSAIAFLRRDDRKLSKAGELAARTEDAIDDNCVASCVDWYGNARPIFMGDRVFALMGYEIVEGRMSGGQIGEKRRISFAP